MTDKIIIDGVNAAECEFLSKEHSFTNPKGQCKIKLKDCKFINNCQYKQLKRSEQENAELKAYKDVNEDFKTAWEELKAENDTLKSQLDFEVQKKEVFETENERLKSCLQEIKEIADARCDECKYGKDGISCKYGDCGEAKLHLITQLITKAEEE